jgi:hypothetical protein
MDLTPALATPTPMSRLWIRRPNGPDRALLNQHS